MYGANSEIVHYSNVFARRQNVCKQETRSCKNVSTFLYCETMTSFLNYVTDTIRALFGVTRLIWSSSTLKGCCHQNNM